MDVWTFNIYSDFIRYHNANLCGIYNPLKKKDLKKKSNMYFLSNEKNLKSVKLKPLMTLPEIKYQMYSIPDINSDRRKFTNLLVSLLISYVIIKRIYKSDFLMSFYFIRNLYFRSILVKYVYYGLVFRMIYYSLISSEQKY